MSRFTILFAAVCFASASSIQPDSTPPSGDGLARRIIEDAVSYLGTPYVYGGTGPAGFDCSGLVYRVFGDNGVPLPRTAGAMADAGVQVPRDSLQPGDLLIFREPGHVGIYVGDSLFIHSSSYMNVGVVLTPIGQTNYVRRFVSAVRVTP